MIVNPSGENKPDQNERHQAGRPRNKPARGRGESGRRTTNGPNTDLQLMRERWNQAETASMDQRTAEQDDLAFYADKQWPSQVVEARKGQPANQSTGTPPVPARPLFTVNLIKEPIRHVLNQERQSDYGLELVPADDWGEQEGSISHDEIKTREGIVRRIQRQSNAQVARNWAFERASIAGRGWYVIESQYISDRSTDQELIIKKIYNQFGCMDDPNVVEDDGSDREFFFLGQDLAFEQYKALYPRLANGQPNDIVTSTMEQWRALGDEAPGWFRTSGKVRYVRLMRYYHIERTPRIVVHLTNGRTIPKVEQNGTLVLPPGAEPEVDPESGEVITREVQDKTVWITTTDGVNVFEEARWVTKDIPVIKVVGESLHPYDEKREERGLVRGSKSSNQGFNWLLSRGVETIALQPIPPLMLADGQQDGFETWFNSLATRPLPYVVYKSTDREGNLVGAPTRAPSNVDLVTPIAALIQLFQGLVKSTTGVPDPTLGNVDPALRSARALRSALEQAEKGTSNFMDNLQTSIRFEAKILNEAIPHIYNRPGRLAQMVNGDGEAAQVMLHTPFLLQSANGPNGPQRPVAAPHPEAPGAQTLTFTKDAEFNTAIKVGKNYDTRREEEADEVGELIAADPVLMTWFGDKYIQARGGPASEEMAKRARVMLADPIKAMLDGQQQIPPALQAQMQQAQQLIQQLQQQNQELEQKIQTKQVEKEADLQKAAMDNQTKKEIAELQQIGAFAVASLKAQLEQSRTAIEAMKEERIALDEAASQGREHAHAHRTSARDHLEELALMEAEARQTAGQAEQAHRHAMEQSEAGHQQALAQGEQAAALAPKPGEGE